MDWLDKTRIDTFSYELVDPFNINSSRGYFEGVISDSPSLTFGYYTFWSSGILTGSQTRPSPSAISIGFWSSGILTGSQTNNR